MAISYNTYTTPTQDADTVLVNVTEGDRLLIRRPYNMIGQGKWTFTHIPAIAANDPEFHIEGTFAHFIHQTPAWFSVTTTGTEFPEWTSAIRIRSNTSKDGGYFSTVAPGNFELFGTDRTETYSTPGNRSVGASRTSLANQIIELTKDDGDIANYIITVTSSDTSKVTVSDIQGYNSKRSTYTLNRVAAGTVTITHTLTPLHGGSGPAAKTRTITWS